jgi:tetratricopeptide (TPR) repeat protein
MESTEEKDFDLMILYVNIILKENKEHSLDDAYGILSSIEKEGVNNFDWNYLMAKVDFQMGIYDKGIEYVKKALEINTANGEAKKLFDKMKNMINYLKSNDYKKDQKRYKTGNYFFL